MAAVRRQQSGSPEYIRQQIYAPPGHGKSMYWSVYAPAFYYGHFPDKNVAIVSHTQKLATRFSEQARDLMEVWAPSQFGLVIDRGSSGKSDWRFKGRRGSFRAFGVGSNITGSRVDFMVVDDPVKNNEEAVSPVYRAKAWDWWQSTASTRQNPGCITTVMMTRWHEDDLAGRLNKHAEEVGRPWNILSLPAIALEDDPLGREPGEALWPGFNELQPDGSYRWKRMFDAEMLAGVQLDQTPYWWGAMYQQHPSSYGDLCWPEDYFEDIWAEEDEWPEKFRASAIAIDPSKGKNARRGDFCAMIFMGLSGRKIWIDARLSRVPVPQIVEEGLDWYTEKRPLVFGVEGVAFQEYIGLLFQEAAAKRGLLDFRCQSLVDMGGKELRIERLSPSLQRHLFKIRKTAGGRELYRQLREFPRCDHDDGPDGMEMAQRMLLALNQRETVIGRAG